MAFNQQEQSIIQWGLANGKTKEDVTKAIGNFRAGITTPKPETQPTKEPGYLDRVTDTVGTDLNNRVDRTSNILDRKDTGLAEKGVQLFGQGTGLAANTLETAVNEIPGVKTVTGAIGKGIDWLSKTTPFQAIGEKIGGTQAVQEATRLYDTDPNFKDTVDAVANVARLGLDIDGALNSANFAKNVTSKLASGAKNVVGPLAADAAEAGSSLVKGVTEKAKGLLPEGPNELQVLNEKISPKPTIKEAKLAEAEGRLVKGKEPTLFKKGTIDQVLTPDQQFKSVQTINKLIKDHATMTEPDLYTALEEKISDVAKNFKPEAQKVPITEDTIRSITEKLEKLKNKIKDDSLASEEGNVAKRQDQFEKFLKKSKSDNFDDLWETAKEYDRSIPDKVKKANSLSSETLQDQRMEWLQRRAILRSALTEASNGLGELAKKAFSDMTDMFEAQEGILSKAKINLKPKPSKTTQFVKDHPIIKAGVKAAGLDAIVKGVR